MSPLFFYKWLSFIRKRIQITFSSISLFLLIYQNILTLVFTLHLIQKFCMKGKAEKWGNWMIPPKEEKLSASSFVLFISDPLSCHPFLPLDYWAASMEWCLQIHVAWNEYNYKLARLLLLRMKETLGKGQLFKIMVQAFHRWLSPIWAVNCKFWPNLYDKLYIFTYVDTAMAYLNAQVTI